MKKVKHVRALEFIRKLRGGSQPILLRASDGLLYVVKFRNNLQGPNLPFNEVLGTELFRQAGLQVPQWSFVEVTDDFLDKNPSCWIETEDGRRRPTSGLCFGSQLLSLRSHSLFEILPRTSFSRILNRKDFWTAWVIDVLCEHSDSRQGIFLKENTNQLNVYFIDQGHMFGGADGTAAPKFLVSRFLDPRIYCEPCRRDADAIRKTIQRLDWEALLNVASWLPDPMFLKSTVHFILSSFEPEKKVYGRCAQSSRITYRCQDLYAQIPGA